MEINIEKIQLEEGLNDLLLSHEKTKQARLGQGIHKTKDDEIFYYGTEIFLDNKPCTAIVASNKMIYFDLTPFDNKKNQETRQKFDYLKTIQDNLKLNFRTSFDDNAIAYHWKQRSIYDYLNDKKQPRTLKQIVEDIENIFKTYCKFENKDESIFHACTITNTYFAMLFDYQPRIEFRGLTSSGKTTASKLYKQLAFNSLWLTKNTDAARYRDVEATCGTIIIDNYDTLNKEVKEAMQFFIETTFERENGAYRLTEKKGDGYRTTTLDAYCPMVFNSIIGLGSDATKNRCFTTVMQKHKGVPKINMKDQKFEEIRNELRLYGLYNWDEVKNTYGTFTEKQIENRTEDNAKPILTIAKLCGKDIYERVLKIIVNKAKAVEEDAGNENFERLIMNIIFESFSQETEKKIIVSEIAEKFIGDYWGYDKEQDRTKFIVKRTYAGKIVKSAIMSIPGANEPGRITTPRNQCCIELKRNELLNFMFSRGYLKEEEKGNTSKSEKTLTNTNNTNNTNIKNEKKPKNDKLYLKPAVSDVSDVSDVSVFSKCKKKSELEAMVVERDFYD